jgi:hypothetical protein
VAAGFAVTGEEADAAVWISPDGRSWTRVEDSALSEPGTQRIYSLVVTPLGLVAGGTHYHPNQFGLYNLDARIWVSADGSSWEVVDDATFGGPGWQFISTVVATPEGLVAAGGNILGQPGFHNDAAVWTSADGRTWARVSDPALSGIGAQHISSLVLGPDGLIAVGYDTAPQGNRIPAVWSSRDGTRWVRVVDPGLTEPGHRWMNAVAADAKRLVAVGTDGTRPVGDPALWWSAGCSRSVGCHRWSAAGPQVVDNLLRSSSVGELPPRVSISTGGGVGRSQPVHDEKRQQLVSLSRRQGGS